jgi:hypothetical protein
MTRPVTRDEVLDLTAYEKARPLIREQVLAVKAPRRVHLGDALTFLFENRDTVRYQIQEMVRAERMVKEEDIAHELETYNELLGKKGELGAVLPSRSTTPCVAPRSFASGWGCRARST